MSKYEEQRDRNLFGARPVSENWDGGAGFSRPDRLVLMTLQKGRGKSFDVVFGKRSQVFRDVGNLSAAELDATISSGIRPPSAKDIVHRSPHANRPRTTLSLASQGSFYVALALTGDLKVKAKFADKPFGANADKIDDLAEAPIKYFWWSHVLNNGRIAVMAAHNPIGNTIVIPYNINLIVTGGSGSGDNVDHYDGVQCETPIIIDPDMRWPDGTEPPNLPPPPG